MFKVRQVWLSGQGIEFTIKHFDNHAAFPMVASYQDGNVTATRRFSLDGHTLSGDCKSHSATSLVKLVKDVEMWYANTGNGYEYGPFTKEEAIEFMHMNSSGHICRFKEMDIKKMLPSVIDMLREFPDVSGRIERAISKMGPNPKENPHVAGLDNLIKAAIENFMTRKFGWTELIEMEPDTEEFVLVQKHFWADDGQE